MLLVNNLTNIATVYLITTNLFFLYHKMMKINISIETQMINSNILFT